ncbi:hypothetical protein SDC9_109630 [bioreactor metagenome]|uniref:HTH tetR-type domain-containing protein n=1 Tax=bioreactor metagenome TaxID=1076179 RepID=A0A645BHS9_9ZZZZ
MPNMDGLVNMPRTKRGVATLNNILSAAAHVFFEKGYHQASIHDITSLAGVAAGTFYIYFDGKYNLYRFLLLQCSHRIRRNLYKSIQDCKTRREAERVGIKSWLQFVRSNQYMYHIIWESLYVDKQLFVDYYVNFCNSYRLGLDAAFGAGELREIDTEVLAYTLMGASNFLGLNWGLFRENNSDEELERVTNEFMKILEGGVFQPEDSAEHKPMPKKEPEETIPNTRFRIELDEEDSFI